MKGRAWPLRCSPLLVLALSCAEGEARGGGEDEGEGTPTIVAERLELDLEGPSGGRLRIRAESGRFSGLPGRSDGRLEGVAFSLVTAGRGDPTVSGAARRATLDPGGGLSLEGATLRTTAGLVVEAERAELGPGSLALTATGVRARLRGLR